MSVFDDHIASGWPEVEYARSYILSQISFVFASLFLPKQLQTVIKSSMNMFHQGILIPTWNWVPPVLLSLMVILLFSMELF